MDRIYDWREAPPAEFGVIGDPIRHSLSPKMHRAAYAALGMDLRYLAIHVPDGEFREAIDHLGDMGYQGLNVTVPHKHSAVRWASDPDAFSDRVQSANTLRLSDRSATNTDAPGFLDTLPALGIWPSASVLLLGAGSSARALLVALEESGYRVRVYNRTFERAREMVKAMGVQAEVLKEPDPEGVALIVNATSASLAGESVPVIWSRAGRKTIVYDLAYGQELTPFLLQGALAGLKVVDGREMLVAQGARSFEWWFGRSAPYDAMYEAVQ